MSKRIFIAVDISSEAKGKISNYIEELRRKFPQARVSWEKPEKLHLTLKFIGKTSAEQLSALQTIIAEIASRTASFKLRIQNTGVFPAPINARVLWLDVVDENKVLTEINRRLEDKCEKAGFAKEPRKYVPHLTIARIKEPAKTVELAEKHLQTKFEPAEFEVSAIVIYESLLQPAGSVYSVVSKHQLG